DYYCSLYMNNGISVF
nr:immunoglobulin light chain junction region [Macaca mulatta]